MKILILGTGYIGKAVVLQWTNPYDRFSLTTTNQEKQKILQATFLNTPNVSSVYLLKGSDQKALLQLITEVDGMIVTVAPRDKESYEETYLTTAYSISKALVSRKKPFYLLYTSSTSVYGDHQGALVDETSFRFNLTPNGKILSQTEDVYLTSQNEVVQVCLLRLAGIYGPERELEKRARELSGKKMKGDKNSPTNHIHRNDVVRAIEFCFYNRLQGIYNLSNTEHPLRGQLYDSLCQSLLIASPQWNEISSSSLVSNCCVSSRKIQSAGFEFAHPFL